MQLALRANLIPITLQATRAVAVRAVAVVISIMAGSLNRHLERGTRDVVIRKPHNLSITTLRTRTTSATEPGPNDF